MSAGRGVGRPELGSFRSVTVVKPSSLGDIVHAMPAVAALRAAMPRAVFRWLANPEWMPLLEGSELVDEVVAFPRKSFRGVSGLMRAGRWLKEWRAAERERPELVVDFQGLLRSGIVSWRRGGDWVMGLSDAREGAGWFHGEVVAVEAGGHAVDRYLAVPRALGVEVGDEVRFPLAAGSRPAGWPGGEVIVVHPYSRGEGKSLGPESLRALLEALAPMPVVLVGVGPAGAGEGVWSGRVTNLVNQTSLGELIWCLREARWVISVDSGPMHMAAAVNANTIGLHTWTDPRKVGPYPPEAWVWKAGRICPRGELSAAECEVTREVDEEAAGEVGRWVTARSRHSLVGGAEGEG
jgi:ADP-heptose:LPS heptosyltransferase